MTATITSFRQALATRLNVVLGIDFLAGVFEGPMDKTVGCTFPIAKRRDEDHALEELQEIGVRICLRYDRSEAPELLPDPEPLETLAEQVQEALDDIETTAGPWFFWISDIEFDLGTYRVDCLISGRQENVFQ